MALGLKDEEEDLWNPEWDKLIDTAPVNISEGSNWNPEWDRLLSDSSVDIAGTSGWNPEWDVHLGASPTTTSSDYTSDLDFSSASFKQRQGRGFGEMSDYLKRKTGLDSPDFITNYFQQLEETGDTEVKGYVPDYPSNVLEADSTLGWMGEKVKQQAHEQAVIYGGSFLAQKLMMSGHPYLATISGGATVAITFNTIWDEAMQELAHLNGKQVSELTDEERDTAFYLAIQNTALEFLPTRLASKGKNAFKSVAKDVDGVAKDLSKWLKNVDKDSIIRKGKKFLKSSLGIGVKEGTTEATAQLNTMRLSEQGIGYAKTDEGFGQVVSSGAGGVAGGPVFGSGQSISNSREFNKTISEGTRYLNNLNTQNKFKARDEYVKELNTGEAPAGFDVIPDLYDVPEHHKGKTEQFIELLAEKGLGRSTTEFRNAIKKVKTGRDMYDLHTQVFGSLSGVESFSGDTQGKPSFMQLKSDKLNQYSTRFFDIQSKWSGGLWGITQHRVLAGEMGESVHPVIDAYVGASIEKRLTSEETKAVRKLIGKKRLRELNKDIKELGEIHDKVYEDLSKVLKKSDISLGYTENYLTRGINYKAVKKNKEGFIRTLVDDVGYTNEKAEEVYNDILNGKDPSTLTSKQIREGNKRDGTGKSSFEKARSQKWDSLNSEFRDNSTFGSMQNYLLRAATRAASAETFGGRNAEKFSKSIDRLLRRGILTNQGAESAWDMYDAEHNIYKRPENEQERIWQDISKGVSTVTAVALLGLASVASLTEPMWIPGRVGYMNTLKALPVVAGYVLKGIKRTIYSGRVGKEIDKSFGRSILNTMGMAINPQVNEKIEMMMAGDYNPALTNWFRTPGGLFLTQYTNFVRTWTAAAGLKMMQDQAKKVNRLKGAELAGLTRELKENGMTVDDFKKIVRLGNGKIDILNDEWLNSRYTKSNGTNISVRDSIVPWMRKITIDVALEPHVGNRPLWMSDPNWQLVAQLKSFPILFSNTIAKRTLKQLNPNVCTPGITGPVQALASTGMALAVAAMVIELKNAIRGSDTEVNLINTIGAVGVPYITANSMTQLVAPAGASVLDRFWNSLTQGDLGETAEDGFEMLIKLVAGSIFSEQAFKE